MKHLLASICLILLATGCDKISQTVGSYDDCLLSNLKGVTASYVIEAVKAACKQKYPKDFDFTEIARSANVKSWWEVVTQDAFSSKTDDIKEEIRRQYFADVIQPRVHPDYIVEAGTQFESFSRKIVKEVSNSTSAEASLSKAETGKASSVTGAVTSASDRNAQPDSAATEWVRVGENNRSIAYASTAIRRSGDTAIYWVLFDYKVVQESPRSGKRYLSEKSQREIDCQSERDRALFFTWHSDQMGNGTVIYTGNNPTNWEPTSSPGGFANTFWKFVCSKK